MAKAGVLELRQQLEVMTKDRDFYKQRAAEVGSTSEPTFCLGCQRPMLVPRDELAQRLIELRQTHERARGDQVTAKDRGFFEGLSKALRVMACCMACDVENREIRE